MKKILQIILFISLIFSPFVFVPHTYAVAEGALGAYPTNFDPSNPKTKSWFIYDLKGGEKKQDSITVVNNSDQSLNVKIYAVDATTTSDGAFALLNENQKKQDVGSWVKLSTNEITVDAHNRKDVPFTITIPQRVTVGDHAGGIIIQNADIPTSVSQGMGVTIVSRVGTRIYETVPGAKIVSLDINNIQYKIVDDHLVFTFTMVNNGNVILTPTGNLAIADATGKQLESLPLENLGAVFPGKPTDITVTSHIQAPLFGAYKASVTLNYSPTKAISKDLQFFIYVKDWKIAAGAASILLILLTILITVLKKVFFHAHRIRQIRKLESVAQSRFEENRRKNGKSAVPVIAHSESAQATITTNVDQLFITRHIKMLVILSCITILVLSSLFGLVLQQFVFAKTQKVALATSLITPAPTVIEPSDTPTPTYVPVSKSDMQVVVLNGSGKTGAAKNIADKLTNDGFTVTKTDNADADADHTTIYFPAGKENGAEMLRNELVSDYSNITEEATPDATFTIILGAQ